MANKVIIWDAFDGPVETREQKVRPTVPGIIQLEVQDFESYAMYEYPDKITEFESIDDFRKALTQRVKSHLRPKVHLNDLEYETDTLVDRGISMMANFKIANILLEDRLVHKVLLPPERSTGRAKLGGMRI